MTTLVVGGGGYLGSHLIKEILERGDAVVAFDLVSPHEWVIGQLWSKVRYLKGNILNLGEVFKVIREERVENLVHLAAILTHEARKRPSETARVNFEGTVNVLEACRLLDVKKLVYASSSGVYGASDKSAVVNEDYPKNPSDFYGVTKLASEMYGCLYAKMYGITFTALRLKRLYGPGLRPGFGAYYVINDVVQRALKGQPIHIPADPDELMTITHVRDAAHAFYLSLQQNNLTHQAYNIATESVELQKIIGVIREHVPGANIEVASNQGDYEKHFYVSTHARGLYDISLAQRELGYVPEYGIPHGIKDVIEWYKSIRTSETR